MGEIIFLGTSASISSLNRDNTSLFFTHKKISLLIDCPGSPIQKLIKIGKDFKTVKNIILTHEHPDHIYGLVSLIHSQSNFNKSINIFSSAPCINKIKKLITLFKLKNKIYPQLKYINVLKRRIFFEDKSLRIQAIANSHCSGSFGIKISLGNKAVFYSSDTSFNLKMLKKTGEITYLIHDCTASESYFKKNPSFYKMHTSAKQLSNYLKTEPKIKLIPIHFLLLNENEYKEIKKDLKLFKDNVIWVNDFDTIKF